MFDLSTLEKLQSALAEMGKKRNEIAEQLSAADRQIAALQQLLVEMGADFSPSISYARVIGGLRNEDAPSGPVREDVKAIRNAAFHIFERYGEEHGREMNREQILEALALRGIVVGGKDPLSNLSAHLSHDGRFRPVRGKRGYWTLTKWEREVRTFDGPSASNIPDPLLSFRLMPAADAMTEWFLENYKEPADGVPHDSGEGGYQYVNGGPYDPRDVLTEQFPDASDEEREKAVDELYSLGGADWVKQGQY